MRGWPNGDGSAVDLRDGLTEARFQGTALDGTRFQATNVTRCDFSGATGVLFDPAENCLHQIRLSLEAAVEILGVVGIVVDGM